LSKQVSIGKLRIRVPAAQAGNPKALAAEVAKHLGGAAGGWQAGRVDAVHAKIRVGGGSAPGLAQSIARSVNSSMANSSKSQQGGKS
jgi:hypothetical protein